MFGVGCVAVDLLDDGRQGGLYNAKEEVIPVARNSLLAVVT